MNNTTFSAAPSVTGYLFQCRYALFESLKKTRKGITFTTSIEALDDVTFQSDGAPLELLQTKHHQRRTSDLTDASVDLWKSIRIWSEGIKSKSIPDGATFFLITTSTAGDGSIATYLRGDNSRNVGSAIERLNSVAGSSTNRTNEAAYLSFRSLTPEEKKRLFQSVFVVDSVPVMADLDSAIKEEIFHAVEFKFLDSFVTRLEGWWLRRVIKHLVDPRTGPILSEELLTEIANLREQFKTDNLPIDDDIFEATVDASGYQDRMFVHQLQLIEVGNPRIFLAIRNYFRAFEQRSRWIREDLLLVGDLERYEDRLIEEWELYFERMKEELGTEATEEAKKLASQALYKWVEDGLHLPIRTRLTEPFVSRGSYHILADSLRVGWHPEYATRLQRLIESREGTA